MEQKIKQRIAGKAVIVHDDKVLIIRESPKYDEGANTRRYDFPGGRVEPGETFHTALTRETKEECGLDVEIGRPIFVGEWSPMVKGARLQIIGIFMECRPKNLDVVLSQDHDEYKWISPNDRDRYDLIPPIKEVLECLLGKNKRFRRA
ncbi:MAG TPA: NUDIX hydrolase [Patescibacteria group bacterium]|uniref:Nudix hydrolase domain-containing protein n=1 Tax=Candidatus Sungbacteria bacterium RIFCSPHIGHO2_02_FULL_47_11 TaxID=1802270 RepID=A0A1G2KGU2_9BACT|nr:MAG: hypothetical protein A3C07_02410 [Candidatus Sungbacteria bacterium RIFCSPHIGHO2_02_FULL_47_11]HLC99972.1 NUDIX hydrolase [Patescibacteria group bacterium]